MDKALFKRICGRRGAAGPALVECPSRRDWRRPAHRGPAGDSRRSRADLPDRRLVVKPARLGSSIGVAIVHRPDEPPELESAIEDGALRTTTWCIAEPYLDHPRELEVALVAATGAPTSRCSDRARSCPVASSTTTWPSTARTSRRTLVTPELDPALASDVRRIAAAAFLAIGRQGFARVDFLLTATARPGYPEINTIPGFTPISLFPLLCAATGGYDFGAMCERIVALALERVDVAAGTAARARGPSLSPESPRPSHAHAGRSAARGGPTTGAAATAADAGAHARGSGIAGVAGHGPGWSPPAPG